MGDYVNFSMEPIHHIFPGASWGAGAGSSAMDSVNFENVLDLEELSRDMKLTTIIDQMNTNSNISNGQYFRFVQTYQYHQNVPQMYWT